MRKSITTGLIAVLAIVMCAATAQAQTSGTIFDLKWEYNEATKTLTISGEGSLPDFKGDSEDGGPWIHFKSQIENLVIQEGVTKIGNYAFAYLKNLVNVTLPKSLTSIAYGSFEYCSSLKQVTIPNSVEVIGINAFLECEGMTSLTLSDGLKKIEEHAFKGCKKLTAVTIPAQVETIQYGAFADCANLSAIKVAPRNSHFQSIDGVLFNKDETILFQYPAGRPGTTYTIPANVEEIEIYAFSGCDKLTSVTLSSEMEKIHTWAFAFCSALKSMTIPAGVKMISPSVFFRCSALTKIEVDTANMAYASVDGVLFDKAKTVLLQYPIGRTEKAYTIPNGVKKVDLNAFFFAKNLSTVSMPKGLTEIEKSAFSGSGLSSVSIPSGVNKMSNSAFLMCEQLTSVTIPASVTDFSFNTFSGCGNLKSLTVGMKTPPDIRDKYVFLDVPLANVTLTVPKGSKAAYAAAPVWKEFKQIAESTVANAAVPEARIYAAEGLVYMTLPQAATVRIYSLNGVLVRSLTAPAGLTTVALPEGIYIVRTGERTEKVLVN